MKRLIFTFLVSALMVLPACDTKPKEPVKVKYEGYSMTLPARWEYKVSEVAKGVQQITCSSRNDDHLFILQWFNVEIAPERYIEIMKETTLEQGILKNTQFSASKKGEFNGHETAYYDFSASVLNFDFKGQLISFNKDGKSYFIEYYSSNDEADLKPHEGILQSLMLDGKKL